MTQNANTRVSSKLYSTCTGCKVILAVAKLAAGTPRCTETVHLLVLLKHWPCQTLPARYMCFSGCCLGRQDTHAGVLSYGCCLHCRVVLHCWSACNAVKKEGKKVEVMEHPGDHPAGMMFPIAYELDDNLWPTGEGDPATLHMPRRS